MNGHLIDFEKLPWVETKKGVKFKIFQSGMHQIRLIEFSEGFIEEDWCRRGHSGYIIEGSCAIDFNGRTEYFKAGEIFFISNDDKDKHKVIMNCGQRVLMYLFETV